MHIEPSPFVPLTALAYRARRSPALWVLDFAMQKCLSTLTSAPKWKVSQSLYWNAVSIVRRSLRSFWETRTSERCQMFHGLPSPSVPLLWGPTRGDREYLSNDLLPKTPHLRFQAHTVFYISHSHLRQHKKYHHVHFHQHESFRRVEHPFF